jgi:putative resolvase
MELLRLSRAARRLGVHLVTLRLRADSGKVPVTWAGRERRFSSDDMDAMKAPGGESVGRPRLEGLHVQVPGTTGQESPLDAQEAGLRATATGTVARVFRDRSSGLREDRPGLEKMPTAADGQVTVVRVTHEDHLARFGAGRLRRLPAAHGATVGVPHPQAQGGREELPGDVDSLATTFAGRLYGMASAAARRRLPAEPDRRPPGGGR